ncbi:hypothetical protein AVEN_106849-1 [Araneus ventricosus]|uniref:ISXO2-like transposase domain-containing protein n=1 Tax=Araneus ventricosus TaxID=182803 RepID=A0A4Y2T0C0_ARAVE|nr:hypothetical protein AVEN_106849-1 [Araneus ventricosus]
MNVSEPTVVDWKSFCREVCVDMIIRDSKKLGGVGHVVEIDESKFGKGKYHKGKRVEGKWVFGGIERGCKDSFFCVVEDRTAETLIEITKKYVEPGTTVFSDCWKSYRPLMEEGDTSVLRTSRVMWKMLQYLWKYHEDQSCCSLLIDPVSKEKLLGIAGRE